jgi:enoyl-CoA hydratase/carnithine racemase
MYEAVSRACARARDDPAVRCLVLRGTPGGSFASGTDIGHFRSVRSGSDGVAYERDVQRVLEGLLDLRVPTMAVIEGYALGGGLLLAGACDIRLCTPAAKFGVPVARTLGNCLSQFSFDLMADRLGAARTLGLLLTAELIDADAAATAGFVTDVVAPAGLEARVDRLTAAFCHHAPLTMEAAKLADRVHRTGEPPATDFVRACYGSADFAEGARAFAEAREPVWKGC